MKRYRGWIVFLVLIGFCISGGWLTLQVTAEYPTIGEPVSYQVNQVEGFELKIEEPTWSPFKGYSIRWKVMTDSQDVYYFVHDGEAPNSFGFLEHYADGQWYRLGYIQDDLPFTTIEFALGGEEGSSLEGTIVQKYAYYGTRLESGTYRVVLEMRAEDGAVQYLAAEFNVE